DLLVDRTEDARVLARWPVVAHHEVLSLADDPLERAVRPRAVRGRGAAVVAPHHVWLLEPDRRLAWPGHEDAAVLEADRVARHADDPLDERDAVRLEARAARRVEDDDVPVVVAVEPGRELVDQDVLPVHDRRDH